MSIISIPYTFTTGNPIIAGEHNLNFSTIYNNYNGNITTDNISPSAGIIDSQLAQIVSTNKVSGAALTLLGSIPTGGGTLPSKNGGTGGDLSTAAQGAVPYFSATGVESALAVGTSGQYLKTQGASSNPVWSNPLKSKLASVPVTSGGSGKTVTGIGFSPISIMFFGGRQDSGSIGIMSGILDSALTHFSVSAGTQADGNSGSSLSTSAIIICDLDGNPLVSITITSLDSDGFTYTVNTSNASNSIYCLCLGSG